VQTQSETSTTKPFSAEEVNLQAQRILDHVTFRNSPTLSSFLKFVISETVQGRERQIKEYVIAMNVLNRSRDFKPNEDAVVRIHAGRLRRALNEYYITNGINDPIIIQIPKGSYVPEFSAPGKSEPVAPLSPYQPGKGSHPVVAVLPFSSLSETNDINELSQVISEQVSGELSRFRDITVIGYYSIEMTALIRKNILDAARSLSADYIITGSLQYFGQRILTRMNLLKTRTGEVIMTHFFEKKILPSGILEVQDEIVHNVIGEVCGHFRLILQKMAKVFSVGVPVNAGIEKQSNNSKLSRSFTIENLHTA